MLTLYSQFDFVGEGRRSDLVLGHTLVDGVVVVGLNRHDQFVLGHAFACPITQVQLLTILVPVNLGQKTKLKIEYIFRNFRLD